MDNKRNYKAAFGKMKSTYPGQISTKYGNQVKAAHYTITITTILQLSIIYYNEWELSVTVITELPEAVKQKIHHEQSLVLFLKS